MTTVPTLPTVACAVITKNEERHLQDCLQSVNWVDEGVVIDAESSDRTADLARGGGAKQENRREARKLTLLAFKLCLSWKTFNRLARAWGMIVPYSKEAP